MTAMVRDQSTDGVSVGRLALPSGHLALFDAADQALVERYRWCANTTKQTTYAQSGGAGRPTVLMHRLILDAPAGMLVDHRNGNGLDNRRANLRLATRAQNMANARRSRTNRSGYRGVSWRPEAGKWHAYIRAEGRRRHLGLFATAWEAAEAYNAAAVETWGDFALLNERVPS